MNKIILLITTLAVLAVAPATASAADTVLSNERTKTHWGYPQSESAVRSSPSVRARKIDKLKFFTENNRPELYVALRSRTVAGREWLQIRLPGRPNGRTGWVPASELGELELNENRLVVNRTTLKATFYVKGIKKWESVIGVGASSTPTPSGRFYVREILPGYGGSYGPVAFGTSAYSGLTNWPGGGVIGIHGTNAPSILPGRVSNGCVRVPNTKILQLKRMMGVGTPIHII